MKRTLLFLVLGPPVGTLPFLPLLTIRGSTDLLLTIAYGYVLGLAPASVTMIADRQFAQALPLRVRVPLTTVVGALASVLMVYALLGRALDAAASPGLLALFALSGALPAALAASLSD